MNFWSIIAAILVLALCIFIHELGHFLSAVWLGIPVDEFSIGFGPRIFKFKRKGIQYTLRAIFLGGYVRYHADESSVEAADAKTSDALLLADKNGYYAQPAWKRFISAFCGPFMNFVMAFVIAVALYMWLGTPVTLPSVQEVVVGSAAYEAGLQPGDVFTSIGGEAVSCDEAGALKLLTALAQSDGNAIDATLTRNGESVQATLQPRFDEAENRYMIGITLGAGYTSCSPGEAIARAWDYLVYITREMVGALGGIFRNISQFGEQVTGPVGTVQIISQTVQRGGMDVLNIIIIISLNLGIINLLPIPGLDGSKLVLLAVEMVRGKPVPPSKEAYISIAGLVLVFALMIFVTFKDISRLFGG